MIDEGVIVEIVRPGTGDPVADGEVGEVVVTTLNPDYPLIRFGTGDLSAVLPGRCPTGRTNTRISGWLGPRRPDREGAWHVRAPRPGGRGRCAAIPRSRRARLVVEGEMAERPHDAEGRGCASTPEGLAERIVDTLRDVTKLRGGRRSCARRAACRTTAR